MNKKYIEEYEYIEEYDESFYIGDIVKLKSGGPNMTIILIKDKPLEKIICTTWFGANDVLHHGEFTETSLIDSFVSKNEN